MGDLSYSSGTLTIDTTAGYWHHTSGKHGTGVITSHDDNGTNYKVCTFTFDAINLQSGLSLVLKGDNSLILKTRNHGNVTIGIDMNLDGGTHSYDNSRNPVPPRNHHNFALENWEEPQPLGPAATMGTESVVARPASTITKRVAAEATAAPANTPTELPAGPTAAPH